jgi:hypothetical protein
MKGGEMIDGSQMGTNSLNILNYAANATIGSPLAANQVVTSDVDVDQSAENMAEAEQNRSESTIERVMITDADGVILYVNPQYLTGLLAEGILHRIDAVNNSFSHNV